MSKREIKTGDCFESWTVVTRIGSGGNGEVWLAHNAEGEECAIKILKRMEQDRYQRFIDEIDVIRKLETIEGIIPLIESYIPENTSKNDFPWYVMPLAKPANRYFEGALLIEKIDAFISLSATLAGLHSQGISHRDIKPDNLLVYQDTLCLSDFGLVAYPGKKDFTQNERGLGAKWTIAPEMKRNPRDADGRAADIYSLAKTLWIFLTGQKTGFEGQYFSGSDIGLAKYLNIDYSTTLDELLNSSTSNDPLNRPNAEAFTCSLMEWKAKSSNFFTYNRLQWKEIQDRLFPCGVPFKAIWTDVQTICNVLNTVGNIKSSNYTFFPDRGGMDLRGAKISREPNCIELNMLGSAYIVKPLALYFYSFNDDHQWDFFRLETARLGRKYLDEHFSEIINPTSSIRQVVVEIGPGEYIDEETHYSKQYTDTEDYHDMEEDDYADEHDDEEQDDKSLPELPRIVIRILEGSFVIFQKGSYYNLQRETDDGRHNRMDRDEFYSHVKLMKNIYEKDAKPTMPE